MGVLLFCRILIDKSQKKDYPNFLGVASVKLFLIYWVYVIMVTGGQGLLTFNVIKETLSIILYAYFVYYYFFAKGNSNILRTAVILSGLICFSDLVYTYKFFGSFPVQRIYYLFSGQTQEIDPDDMYEALLNHNFFGQICGVAFVFALSELIRNRSLKWYSIILLPIMFSGVMMSTSRSALMSLVIMSIIVLFSGLKHKEYRKKVYKVGRFALMSIVVILLLFSTIGMYFNLESNFVDQINFRLAEEPIAIFQKALGLNYNVQNLGSIDWREEAASKAYAAYSKLSFPEQLTGIGANGFMERDLGNGLNPHNGVLLILIETGLVGFILYFILVAGTMIKSIRMHNLSSSFAALGSMLIYGIGQNGDMTSATFFLFVFTIIAEIQFKKAGLDNINYSFTSSKNPAQTL